MLCRQLHACLVGQAEPEAQGDNLLLLLVCICIGRYSNAAAAHGGIVSAAQRAGRLCC
jgi:hypothetical protein